MLPQDPYQLRLSGSGGQGLITAGVILAEAGLLEGYRVAQTQSYGPEARLGASRSEVILSSRPIAYPEVSEPDFLLSISQDAFDKYGSQMPEKSLILVDDFYVTLSRSESYPQQIYALPIIHTAEELGNKLVSNVVALGALNRLLELVSEAHLKEAVLRRVPAKYRELNAGALEAGARLAQPQAKAVS